MLSKVCLLFFWADWRLPGTGPVCVPSDTYHGAQALAWKPGLRQPASPVSAPPRAGGGARAEREVQSKPPWGGDGGTVAWMGALRGDGCEPSGRTSCSGDMAFEVQALPEEALALSVFKYPGPGFG